MKSKTKVPSTYKAPQRVERCGPCSAKLAQAENAYGISLDPLTIRAYRHILEADVPYGTTFRITLDDGSRVAACPRCVEVLYEDEFYFLGQLTGRLRRALRFQPEEKQGRRYLRASRRR